MAISGLVGETVWEQFRAYGLWLITIYCRPPTKRKRRIGARAGTMAVTIARMMDLRLSSIDLNCSESLGSQ